MAADGKIVIDVDLNSKDAEKGINNLNDSVGKIGKQGVSIEKVAAGFFLVKEAIKGAVQVAKSLAETMFDFASSAASMQALNSQFTQVFGNLEKNATTALKGIADQTNIVPERLKGAFTQIAAFAKTTGADTSEALDLTTRATLAAADSAAFYDRSIESVVENLQSFLKGNYENDAALGISATETTRNAMANQLYGQSFKDLNEAQKQLTLLKMVEEGNALSGALGQAAREGNSLENVTGNLSQTIKNLKATIGDKFLQPVIDAIVWLTEKIQEFDPSSMGDKIKDVADFIMNIINPLVVFIKSQLDKIQQFWEENGTQISEAVTNAFNIIKSVIDFVMPAIEFVIRFIWDSIKMIIGGALDYIMGHVKIFTGLFTGDFSKMWEGIKQMFKGAIDIIIGVMNLSFLGGLKTIAVNLVKTFVNSIKGAVDNVVSFFTTMAKDSVSHVKGMAKDVVDAVKGLPTEFLNIGKAVIEGFINGLKALNPITAVKNVFNGVKDAVKGIFDINSPSKWMRDDIVGSIAEGALAGANKYSSEFVLSGEEMAFSIQNPFRGNSPTFNGLGISANGLSSNLGSTSVDNSKAATYNINVQNDEQGIELERTMRRLQFGF